MRSFDDRGWLARLIPDPVVQGLVGCLAFALVAVPILLLRAMFVEPFRIPSGNMVPTLLVGDHVLVAKYVYGVRLPVVGAVARWDHPAPGDVIVFWYPKDRWLVYTKRVIAVPGQRVAVRNHRPVVDGVEFAWEPADEGYVWSDDRCESTKARWFRETVPSPDGPVTHGVLTNRGLPGALADFREVVVPERTVFVLGDNRDNSEDSRRWGFVPIDDVLGRVDRIWFSMDICDEAPRANRYLQVLQ